MKYLGKITDNKDLVTKEYVDNAVAGGGSGVSSITTSAGAHTTKSAATGAVSFNVPTKTSHLTNDSNFLTSHQDISGKFDKSGGTITGSTAVTANFRVGQFTANTSQSVEYQSHVWGGAGKIFMYSQADKAGNVGMYWYPASGTNGGGILNVNQSGTLTLKGGTVVNGAFTANGNIIAGGHSSAIGTIKDAYLSAAKSIANNTATSLCSVSLEAGTWVMHAWLRFPSNATGSRVGNIGTSGASDWQASMAAVNGNISQLRFTRIVSLTSTTTYHLNALQTSGAAMSMAAGSAGGINSIRAVRIA